MDSVDERTGLAPPDSSAAKRNWDKDIRNEFVRKVYGILTTQLLLTFGLIFVFVFVEDVKVRLCGMESTEPCEKCDFYTSGESGFRDSAALECMFIPTPDNSGTPGPKQCNLVKGGGCFAPTAALQSWLTTCVVLTFVFICGMACCEKCAKEVPTNYIVLFSFTLCEAIVLGITCLFVNTAAVGLAAAMTAAVTAGLTFYACTTKTDFTGSGPFLVAALLALIMCGFIGSIFGMMYHVPWLQNVYAGCGCLLFSMFIVYDTQMIMGGTDAWGNARKAQISEDDYVFAALNLYLDIINLFIYLIQLLGSRD